jgi:hypothetical protein
MGKHDPFDLYHAVMGEMWDEEHRKAGAARDRASARSYKASGRPSVRTAWPRPLRGRVRRYLSALG